MGKAATAAHWRGEIVNCLYPVKTVNLEGSREGMAEEVLGLRLIFD